MKMTNDTSIITTASGEKLKPMSLIDLVLLVREFRIGDTIKICLSVDMNKKEADDLISIKLAHRQNGTFYLLTDKYANITAVEKTKSSAEGKTFVKIMTEAITRYKKTDIAGILLDKGESIEEIWIHDDLIHSLLFNEGFGYFAPEDIKKIETYLQKNCRLIPIHDINDNRTSSEEVCEIFNEESHCTLCYRISISGIQPTHK